MNCSDYQLNYRAPLHRAGGAGGIEPFTTDTEIEVYFSKTEELDADPSEMARYLSAEEKERADLFHFEEDRITYISCHALLRIVLSRKLGKDPFEILFVRDIHNKPALNRSKLNFNLTHTRNAFAFAVSPRNYVGIDMEQATRKADYSSIIKNYFSEADQRYIDGADSDSAYRFFLLWTRKEALLKALGVGVITDLKQYSVSDGKETTGINSFNNEMQSIECENHFIYSKYLEDYILSIAVPVRNKIILHQINRGNLKTMFPFPDFYNVIDFS
jgi:phosphopantetheinyl transferase